MKWKRNNEFYIGYTDDLLRRIKQHKQKGDLSLIYYEAYQFKKAARQRERKLKNIMVAPGAPSRKELLLRGRGVCLAKARHPCLLANIFIQ